MYGVSEGEGGGTWPGVWSLGCYGLDPGKGGAPEGRWADPGQTRSKPCPFGSEPPLGLQPASWGGSARSPRGSHLVSNLGRGLRLIQGSQHFLGGQRAREQEWDFLRLREEQEVPAGPRERLRGRC